MMAQEGTTMAKIKINTLLLLELIAETLKINVKSKLLMSDDPAK